MLDNFELVLFSITYICLAVLLFVWIRSDEKQERKYKQLEQMYAREKKQNVLLYGENCKLKGEQILKEADAYYSDCCAAKAGEWIE